MEASLTRPGITFTTPRSARWLEGWLTAGRSFIAEEVLVNVHVESLVPRGFRYSAAGGPPANLSK
jgi:hypothetical protein